ncbi:hypothetical protein [Martelella sp. FOR1707]
MPVFELQGPDGKVYEVDAPDMQTAAAAFGDIGGDQKQADWTYLPGAVVDGIAQGMTFGASDEIAAGLATATGLGGKFGDYSGNLAAERQRMAENREYAPGTSLASEIGGAIVGPGGLLAKGVMKAGTPLLTRMGIGTGLGAAEGTAYGFGTGEGIDDRLRGALVQGGIGAVGGGAFPALVAGAGKAVNAARNVVGGLGGIGNTGRANRAIAETVRKSGRSAAEIQDDIARAAAEGQPEYRLMDATGTAGQRRASGVVRAGGDGSEELAQFLQQRQADQPNRMAGFVEDAFGYRAKPSDATDLVPAGYKFQDTPADVLRRPQRSAADTVGNLKKARTEAANIAYDAARDGAKPVDVRNAVSIIDKRLGPLEGSGIKGNSIDASLSQFRNRLTAKDPSKSRVGSTGLAAGDDGGYTRVDLSDFDRVLEVKRDVQDLRRVAERSGEGNKARYLKDLEKELDSALEMASEGYRKANDDFAKASRVMDAVEQGQQFSRPGSRYPDTTAAFRTMTPEEQSAARIGYGDRALAKIEANASPTSNVAKPFQSTKAREEAAAMALDPQTFANRVGRETSMWETQNRALGGSRTADNLQDIGDVGPMADLGRAGMDLLRLRPFSAMGNLGSAATPLLTGQNEATRTLIARALMSREPEKALAEVMRMRQAKASRVTLLEALMRAASRTTVGDVANGDVR